MNFSPGIIKNRMAFRPEEVLLSPTQRCNLACVHCHATKGEQALSLGFTKKFLLDSKKRGIDRMGFTGGEPFLAGDFLCKIIEFAVKEGFVFDRITTNGVWYKNRSQLKEALGRLSRAGYDGSICVSVDAYHRQDINKLSHFIKTAQEMWSRPDMVSIVYVTGRDAETKSKLNKLARLLGARLHGFGGSHPHIKSARIFISIGRIELSPVGRAGRLKDPWDGKWFKEDFCKGPGNVFFVESDGSVKPCCGYASDLDIFTVGNIKTDTVRGMLKNIRKNRVLYAIFKLGLSRIRNRLIELGFVFPGKTSNHCFFCRYILTEAPGATLVAALKG